MAGVGLLLFFPFVLVYDLKPLYASRAAVRSIARFLPPNLPDGFFQTAFPIFFWSTEHVTRKTMRPINRQWCSSSAGLVILLAQLFTTLQFFLEPFKNATL